MTRRMLVAILVAGGIAGASGGPVVNPGFEEPASDGAVLGWKWVRDDSVATVSVVPGEGVGGSQALLIDKRSPDKEFVVWQRIRLEQGNVLSVGALHGIVYDDRSVCVGQRQPGGGIKAVLPAQRVVVLVAQVVNFKPFVLEI